GQGPYSRPGLPVGVLYRPAVGPRRRRHAQGAARRFRPLLEQAGTGAGPGQKTSSAGAQKSTSDAEQGTARNGPEKFWRGDRRAAIVTPLARLIDCERASGCKTSRARRCTRDKGR